MASQRSFGDFSLQIDKFVEKTGLKADIVVRKIGFDIYGEVLRRSPVDTGRFRASWRIGVARADLSVEPPAPKGADKKTGKSGPPSGVEAALALAKLGKAKFGDTLHISNNVVYAGRLEYGWSKQAPNGVMRVSVAHVVAEFEKTVKSIADK